MLDAILKNRVLIVDDEHVIADTLVLILNQSGFQARAAYSGEMAVEIALSMQPDVVISDVAMAGMNGIDASILISASIPQCRIILFSGQSTTTNLYYRAKSQGHNFEILAKPVHPRVLLDHLNTAA
jgi:DNA-binding NtrC family response regulator